MTEEELDLAVETMTEDDLIYLEDKLKGRNTLSLKTKIDKQVGTSADVFDDLSLSQFYEQDIEISAKLKVTFRTIPQEGDDEAFTYARANAEANNEFVEKRIRRRLAYGLIAINDKGLSNTELNRPYFEMMNADDNFSKSLKSAAEERHRKMQLLPGILVDRLANAYGVWETAVFSRLKGEDISEMSKK